jgi:hypothetical protein
VQWRQFLQQRQQLRRRQQRLNASCAGATPRGALLAPGCSTPASADFGRSVICAF